MSRLDDVISDVAGVLDYVPAYRRIAQMPNCNDCEIACGIAKTCKVKPELGEPLRFNCPLWKEQEDGDTQ